jgi:hypothetical protein
MATTDKQSSRKWTLAAITPGSHERALLLCGGADLRALTVFPALARSARTFAVGIQDRCRVPASSRRTCSDELDGDAEVKLGPRVLSSHGRNTQSLRECKA